MFARRVALTFGVLVLTASAAHADAPQLAARAGSLPSSSPAPTAPVDTPFGLYPLWEHTASLLPSGSFHIGYGRAGVALGPVQLSTQPFLDVYGTWNLEIKLRLWQTDRTRGALILGGYRVPTRAESRTLGNLDAPGFTNPYGPVWLVPVTFAKSAALSSRVALHWASTLLLIAGERDAQRSVSGGQTVMLEGRPRPESPWTARLHAGIEGINVDLQAHAGVSFGYVGETLRLSAGAARRFAFAGEPSTVLLLDAGLMFP